MTSSRLYTIIALIYISLAGNLHAAEYVAYSLKAAEERIADAQGNQLSPELLNLAGLTAVRGLVYDRETEDIILVGERNLERSILTLDDFVVALRAMLIHGKWPLVSIDATAESEKTNMQPLHFEGGLEGTQFGQDLLAAYCRLIQLAEGVVHSGVDAVESYRELTTEEAKKRLGTDYHIESRFWLYPALPILAMRKDVVVIKNLKQGVLTEVVSVEKNGKKIKNLSAVQDVAAEKFAKMVSENFGTLALIHPIFTRLLGLYELVALASGIEEMKERPDLTFWLHRYKVKKVETKKKIDVLTSVENYITKRIDISPSHRIVPIDSELEERIQKGDVLALKTTVLETRPSPDVMSWSILIEERTVTELSADVVEPPQVEVTAQTEGKETRTDSHSITAEEKDTVNAILASGPGSRFVIRAYLSKEQVNRRRISFGGPSPGTTLVVFRGEKEGHYSIMSNFVVLGLSPSEWEGRMPDFSDLPKGTVLRFLGKVAITPCIFEASPDQSLSFFWFPPHGLVYLHGRGTVTLPAGKTVTLPD